jgi:hypothetical protein
MKGRVGVAVCVIGVLVGASLSSSSAAAAAAPATVVVTSRPIVSLAVGGGRVAFRTRRTDTFGHVCDAVHVLPLLGGMLVTPRRCPALDHVGGHAEIPDDRDLGVAVAVRVLAYDSVAVGPLNATHSEAESVLWRVGPNGRRRLARELTCSGTARGRFAYAGGVVFTRTVQTEVDPAMECQLGSGGGPGVSRMTAAGLRFVPAGTTVATVIPGAPGAALIAASGTTVALAPLRLPQPMHARIRPPSAPIAQVQSWDTGAGTQNCTAALAAPPLALATAGARIAALVPGPGGTHLVRLSAHTCAQVGNRALGGRVRAEVAIGRRFVAWATARSVMALDLTTGRVLRLATGRLAPHGLAISSGRVVWWVNGRAHGRILRLRLP